MRKEIVVARYNEDISWLADYPARIYNKGIPLPRIPSNANEIPLPNVGREANTYLTHICREWHNLAHFTVFCQGRNDDHLPPDANVPGLLFTHEGSGITSPMLALNLKEWGDDGRIKHREPWKHRLATGQMRRSPLSMVEWFNEYIGTDIERLGGVSYFVGAIFGVSLDVIKRRPLSYYERILATLSDHPEPEEAYYMERAWLYALGYPQVEMSLARVAIVQEDGYLESRPVTDDDFHRKFMEATMAMQGVVGG